MHRLAGAMASLSLASIVPFVADQSTRPYPLAVPISLVVFLVAALVWFLTRGGDDKQTVSEASSTGDHSPAASASHSGQGDISIDQSTTVHQAGTKPKTTYRGERLIGKSAEELCRIYDVHTSMQADKLVETFTGKPLKISGSVMNIAVNGKLASMHLKGDTGLQLFGEFDSKWFDRLEEIDRGDHVEIIGRIKGISAATLNLGGCELHDG